MMEEILEDAAKADEDLTVVLLRYFNPIEMCIRDRFIIKDAPARVNYPEALGLRHLAFKVKSVDDTVKELNAKGIATEPLSLIHI